MRPDYRTRKQIAADKDDRVLFNTLEILRERNLRDAVFELAKARSVIREEMHRKDREETD